MASLQAATTDEHPNSSRLPRVSASSNPIETLQSVTTYLTAQGVPSSTIIGDYAHAALYHQHSHVPFAAPTGVAAAFMNSLPPHAQNRTSLIHDHTKGVRSLSSQADLNCALVTFQPFPSDPRLLVIPLQYDSLVKISKLLGDGLADTFLAGTTAPAPARRATRFSRARAVTARLNRFLLASLSTTSTTTPRSSPKPARRSTHRSSRSRTSARPAPRRARSRKRPKEEKHTSPAHSSAVCLSTGHRSEM